MPVLRAVDRSHADAGAGSRLIRTALGEEAESVGVRQMHAWLFLVGALAVHVADEAVTDFLGFYNPLVLSIRARVPWFPAPTWTFSAWLAGLIALVVILAALAPSVRRGARGTAFAAYLVSLIMFMNGLGHLGGSVYFQRWLPGATSAPLVLIASILLARRTWERTKYEKERRV